MPALSPPALEFNESSLSVRPWPDEVIDNLGFDPRSWYVETFWLGVLGPSTTWLLRRLATGLEHSPAGFDLELADTARQLGLGDKGGRNSPFVRALTRMVQFELAQLDTTGVFAVRRKVPPLSRRQIARLPGSLKELHQRYLDDQLRVPPIEHLRRRSRRLALSLLELGEDLEATERQLMRWRFHPALARESAAWAWARHREADRVESPESHPGEGPATEDRGEEAPRAAMPIERVPSPALQAVREIAADLARASAGSRRAAAPATAPAITAPATTAPATGGDAA